MITAVTEATFQNEVNDHPGHVVIDFYTPSCPPCRAMAPILDQVAAEHPEIKVVKIDAAAEQDLAVQFGITVVPTFVLVADGARKAQITGLRSKKDLVKWLGGN